jgi:CDP-paratose 2-epimerase
VSVAIITGSAGLVGSEAVSYFSSLGMDIVGIDNGMRADFFGQEGSTKWVRDQLCANVRGYRHYEADIRDSTEISKLFSHYAGSIELIIHAAAQPSHDWAASNPTVDFTVSQRHIRLA